ncbi:MAG: response regulator [Nitrospinae bacterium]|nr:response regulator [Nitrospinota bacterium]
MSEISSFGQYLVDKGLITPEQHQIAVRMQNKNRLMAEIAVELHFLRQEDVYEISDYMEKNPGVKFGEAAVSLRFINVNQLRYLLDVRTRRKVMLGDILVQQDFITEEALLREVMGFNLKRRMLKKILLVEPSPTVTKILDHMLKKFGYEVAKAKNGEEAMSLARTFGPDIMITTGILSDMDGYSLCSRLLSEVATAGMHMIMLSSDDTMTSIDKAFDSGVNHFVKKPVNETELFNVIYQIEREEANKRSEKILVVDDSAGARRLIVKELVSAGFNVFQAENGIEAIEKARRLKPDIITMDIEMPQMDGLAACKALKESPETEDIPVILVSSLSSPMMIEKGFDAGAVEFFTKPFPSGSLSSYVRMLFETRKIPLGEHVLVVDDSAVIRHILKYIFRKNGYKVTAAENGAQAMDQVRKTQVDLVVTDAQMPVKDGLELTREIKDDPSLKHIPVIIVTASSSRESIVSGLASGANDYIIKPFDEAELIARAGVHILNKRLYDEVVREKENLRRTNDLKNKFLGMAAHDLRSPLGSIYGFAQFLRNDFDSVDRDQVMNILDIVSEASDQMLHLIDDLLDISAIESGRIDLDIRTHDLGKVVAGKVTLFKKIAERKGVAMRYDAPHGSAAARFDEGKINQVVDNLLSNAIKFTNKGGEVAVTVIDGVDGVKFSVKDNGVGIPKEEQNALFKSFAKLSVKPTGGEKSTGLGLAIVSKIIKAHDGIIGVESEPGKGSEFFFILQK